jgi:hypothetical protein
MLNQKRVIVENVSLVSVCFTWNKEYFPDIDNNTLTTNKDLSEIHIKGN